MQQASRLLRDFFKKIIKNYKLTINLIQTPADIAYREDYRWVFMDFKELLINFSTNADVAGWSHRSHGGVSYGN